ncbi:MAG: xanthine dehydrogenase family protein [Clostridia bacterium]|nr:xanthine dehydrogenase family protein [Clostridia bacterium]
MRITDKVARVDTRDKISGKTRYIEDIAFENLHYARTLRSTVAKGRITGIRYPEPVDGIFIIDADDVPVHNDVAMIEHDMPVFAKDEVNYIGEPIALIVSKDKNQIIDFMRGIEVTYEGLPAVFDMNDVKEDANHVFEDHTFVKGSIETMDYDEVFEGTYRTGYQEQLYMEKQGVVACVEEGVVTVYGSMQCPYYVKNALMHCTGYDENHVRVVQVATGGAFGGKEEYPSLLACQVAVAALKIRESIRLIFDRREDVTYTTKRHPSEVQIKTYLKDRKIVGMSCLIDLDAGPYLGLSDVVLQRAMFTLTGCYAFENVRVRGRIVRTNNIFTGAFRGFGAPQTMFALEQHMNQLANKLEVDAIQFRRAYFVKKGMITSTSGIFNEDIYLDLMADRLEAFSGYQDLKEDKAPNTGIGVAFVPHGGGFTGSGEAEHIKAVVKLKKRQDGKVEILVSNVEMGQGAKTALSKIVASVLDIGIKDVIYEDPDTFCVPDSGPTVASRTTMVVGNLLYKAAEQLKAHMKTDEEITITEHFKQPDYVIWDQETMTGNAYMAYSWSAVLAKVTVDPLTYEITCTDIYGVYDVGIPIDEGLFLGQVHGGVVQGLGYGLMEQMVSKNGKVLQDSFESYTVPTASDIPEMQAIWIENKYVDGPYGAKAVGELTLVAVAPAVASAVADAIGKSLYQIPVTPEMLLEVTRNEKR